jgi:c-di-GMP-binding flagellar brake protein YcgR
LPILFIVVVALGVIYLVVSRPKKEGGANWVQFFSKGKEAGFSLREIEILRQLTVQSGLEPPESIFESQAQLDKCIHSLVRSMKMSGESEGGNHDFLSRLYDYRQKIEINKNREQKNITNSRQISEGQELRILVVGTGVFQSQVVRNVGQYLTISRPVNSKKTSSMSWAGLSIAVYFWREGDAGYVFDSEVIDEVFSLGISSLKITHGESLFRTQKRKSVRTKVNKPAFLYLVPADEPPHKLAAAPGVKCLMEDLSDTGCAVAVGGKAGEGLRVKVQFALNNIPVCITGTVRSANYREDVNRTVLRIEAEPLSREMKNHILSEVFGMLPDDNEDELPFRVLDDEVATLTGGGSRAGSGQVDIDQMDDDQMDDDQMDGDQPNSAQGKSDRRVSVDVSVTRRGANG